MQRHPVWRFISSTAQGYTISIKVFAPEDIHVYSIDEVFIDVTNYLKAYGLTARKLAAKIIKEVLKQTRITATAGIGTNLYLCKVAMDIIAKHIQPNADGGHIAELNERSYRQLLWSHTPITDFWRVEQAMLISWKLRHLCNGRCGMMFHCQ